MRSHRLFAPLSVIAFGAAILFLRAPPVHAARDKLILENFFNGRLTGQGVFNNHRDGNRRDIKMDLRGSLEGEHPTVNEDIVFSDGERQNKVWTFTKVGEGRYVGRRADLVGTADIVQEGDQVRMNYTARVHTKGSVYTLNFDELYTPEGPLTLNNRTKVSYFFFPVGDGEMTIRKIKH